MTPLQRTELAVCSQQVTLSILERAIGHEAGDVAANEQDHDEQERRSDCMSSSHVSMSWCTAVYNKRQLSASVHIGAYNGIPGIWRCLRTGNGNSARTAYTCRSCSCGLPRASFSDSLGGRSGPSSRKFYRSGTKERDGRKCRESAQRAEGSSARRQCRESGNLRCRYICTVLSNDHPHRLLKQSRSCRRGRPQGPVSIHLQLGARRSRSSSRVARHRMRTKREA